MTRLLVPVANPETADRLVDTAIDLAQAGEGSADDGGNAREIVALHVVAVPMAASLEQARDQLDEEREAVQYAVDLARDAGVAATGRLRFGRSVAGGIVDVADELDVEAILLGWRGRPRRRDVVLGSYIDEVLADAPCDVLVKRIDREGGPVSSVLVPVAGGPNTEYAAAVAGTIARARDARVELVHVVAPGTADDEVSDARSLLNRAAADLGAVESVAKRVLTGDDVVATIVERSREHDLTVVGAAEGGFLRRVLVGELPERIAREADGAVVMARRRRGVSDALWRRLRDRVR